MDTARAGNPNAKSRYDRRDLRCLEFLEATPREQALNAVAQQQAQMTTILPAIMDRMAANDERMAALMEQFAAQNAAQTEALKAIAGQGTRGKRDAA
jgi:predicted ArsR family transcriptional regulator